MYDFDVATDDEAEKSAEQPTKKKKKGERKTMRSEIDVAQIPKGTTSGR